MPRRAANLEAMDRSPAEWAVLGLIAEAPTHGFAIARELASDGSLGRIWTVPRPLVYRAMKTLERDRMVAPLAIEPGDAAPPRRIVGITRSGRRALRQWFSEPVVHVRDLRGPLLLKLALIDRSGDDPTRLLQTQADLLDDQLRSLRRAARSAGGFDRTLMAWRAENAMAAKRFVTQALDRAGADS